MNSNTGNHYPIASLYVGDLAPDVTEAILFEKFSTAGPVLSIRVCRDIITRRSLGYAYVNYQNSADAERAIDTLNFERLAGRPIRIMWSQRDPSLRRSGLGNIFIKNLDRTVDNKIMFDTFSVFGNILSCKVSFDDKGQSKGYGFVHFDSDEAATSAIENLNGKIVNNKKIFVGKFLSRKERETKLGGHRRFTNVYVKNLTDEHDTDEKLQKLFETYGEITSAIVVKDDAGKSRGFGFVCFSTTEGAESAVAQLNGKEINGKQLYVGRAQKKAEREAELRRKLDAIKAERINRNQGVNLYVKNLEDSINDERLQREFASYGTITSAKVMTDERGQSKGFGFVCFSTPEEATKAVTEMNNRIIVSKPLYVALAQRKEDREAQKLNLRYGQTGVRLPQAQLQPGMPGQGIPGAPPQFQGQNVNIPMQGQIVPGMHQPPYLMPVANPMAHGRHYFPNAGPGGPQLPNVGGARTNQRWNNMNQPGQRQNAGQFNPNYRGQNPRNVGPQVAGVRAPLPAGQVPPNGQGARGGFVPQGVAGATGVPQQARGVPAARGGPQGGPAAGIRGAPKPGAGVPPQMQGFPIDAAAPTAGLSHEETIQLLGEQLYPKVSAYNTENAGKITGMLLEMDPTEIHHMLESGDLLKSKVDEAMAVLQAHRAKEPAAKE